MTGCKRLAVLALLALVLATLGNGAAPVWKQYTYPRIDWPWKLDVLPSGIGYAAEQSNWFIGDLHYTKDGGKVWRRVKLPMEDVTEQHSGMWTLANGNAIVTWSTMPNERGEVTPFVGHLTPATNQTTIHTVEIPKGMTKGSASFYGVAVVPGQSKAFAWGTATGLSTNNAHTSMNCMWYWSGGTAWKVYKVASSVNRLMAASPTAAWASVSYSGEILRWNGNTWARLRPGAAGETIELLKAAPPVGSTPGMLWAKLTKIKTGQGASETLLLCTTSSCTAKRAAAASGKYPGRFLTPGGFGAASSKLAFVWEAQPSNNPNKTVVALQQFNGTKWTTAMKVVQQQASVSAGPFMPPQTVLSPELHVSVASPTRAVALLAHRLPAGVKTGTLVTHTWNGAKWTPLANATFEIDLLLMPTGKPESQVYQLVALPSGTALLTLISSMWRLA